MERSVRALDGAVAIIDAVAGVQAQTEKVWNQATNYGVRNPTEEEIQKPLACSHICNLNILGSNHCLYK